jgi:AraC-like DNA-binding protein
VALESLASFLDDELHNPILKLKPVLKIFLNSLLFYLDKGISCKHYYELKQKELFFILHFFYAKEEIATLFAPIISRDLNFKALVLKNYMKAQSIKELARICNYSLSSFSRRFKNTFSESPYKWMQNKRLKYIIERLNNKDISFGEIIDEFNFSSPAHFTLYCKKYLNLTPSQYRKQYSIRKTV